MDVEKVVLEGRHTRLEPLEAQHLEGLAEAILDGNLWTIPVTFVPHPDDLGAFLHNAENALREQKELAFVTLDKTRNVIAGSTRFRCIDRAHRRVEIGFTFLRHSAQRTFINTEAKYLMLTHAFEHWRCNRVELLTDVLNEKSRNAILRIGATQEGILRNHMIMRDGRVRDSVIYSITLQEWPGVKDRLERMMQPAP